MNAKFLELSNLFSIQYKDSVGYEEIEEAYQDGKGQFLFSTKEYRYKVDFNKKFDLGFVNMWLLTTQGSSGSCFDNLKVTAS